MNYEEKLKECSLVKGVSSIEEVNRLKSIHGEPSVYIPEYMSVWKANGYFDPFNEEIQYDEDETGRFEKPCFYKLGWK